MKDAEKECKKLTIDLYQELLKVCQIFTTTHKITDIRKLINMILPASLNIVIHASVTSIECYKELNDMETKNLSAEMHEHICNYIIEIHERELNEIS